MRALRVQGDTWSGRSRIPCKCVAKIPRAPHSSRASTTAPPMAVPCEASVPRPSSSTMIKLPAVHELSMDLISSISTAKELRPSTGESVLAMRTISESKRGTCAETTGACKPHCASNAKAATERSTVLFPAMFGPVSKTSPSMSNVFSTVSAPSIRIQNGTKPLTANGLVVSPSGRSVGGVQRLLIELLAWARMAVVTVDNVAAPTSEPMNPCKSSARFTSVSETALAAICVATL